MENFFLVIALAIIVEAMVEYVKSIIIAFSTKHIKTAFFHICAVVFSITLCFLANANLFEQLGIHFDYPEVGLVLTGIFASRGSNYLSDILGKFQSVIGNTEKAFKIEEKE